MKRRFSLIIIAVLICFFALPATAEWKSKPASQAGYSAEEAFVRLRAKDPNVTNLVAWENAASPLIASVEKNPKAKSTASTLYGLGQLYEYTYRKRKYRTGLSRALYFYEQLARSFPGNEAADNALLAMGDLRRTALSDEVGARAAYYEIIDRYGKSDSADAARERVGEKRHIAPESKKTEALQQTAKLQAAVAPVMPPVRIQAASSSSAASGVEAAAPEELPPPVPSSSSSSAKAVPVESHQIFSRDSAVRRPLIVIDAGHGGEDLGAVSPDGLEEKKITLELALLLDELLKERLRARTVLTRKTDVFIPLPERTKIANDNNADLFISIHTNASEFRTASGIETYYLDNTQDKSSLKLAERENRSLLIGGGSGATMDLGFIVSDVIQNVKLDDSISLAHHMQESLFGTLTRYYKGVNNLGVKKAPFYVLVGAHMPCILVEVSFIDHPLEGPRLADERYQKLIAQSLYQGVRDFFYKKS